MAYKYFLYSSQQEEFMRSTEAKRGRTFKVGTVYTKGTRKSFTELATKPTNRYSDCKLVAEGEEANMKFTLPGA